LDDLRNADPCDVSDSTCVICDWDTEDDCDKPECDLTDYVVGAPPPNCTAQALQIFLGEFREDLMCWITTTPNTLGNDFVIQLVEMVNMSNLDISTLPDLANIEALVGEFGMDIPVCVCADGSPCVDDDPANCSDTTGDSGTDYCAIENLDTSVTYD